MQILSLDLENTKSYRKAHIDFKPGVNAIVGQNGAGKSTIVEAIGFALFDWLGYKHKDFVREGERTASVTVTFISSADDRRYEVVRRAGGSSQYYVYDPELEGKVCEGKADVLAFLCQNMGVEPGSDLGRLFSDAVGVPQGAFTAAFLLTPSSRKSTFDPLLQVEEYKRAFDKLREPLSLLRTQQQELDVQMAGLRARLEQLPALESAIEERSRDLTATEQTLAATAADLVEVEQARIGMDSQQQQVAELRTRKTTLAAQLAAGEQQRATAATALDVARTAQALVTENQPGHDAYLTAQAEQKRLDARVRGRQAVRDQSAAADRTLALANSELKRVAQALAEIAAAEELAAKLAPAVARQSELEVELSAARQAHARLQAAQRQLGQQEQALDRLQSRRAELESQLAGAGALETGRAQLETDIEQLQSQLQSQRSAQAAFKVEAETIKEQSQALEAADADQAACPVCEQPLTEAHRAEMLARNEQRLADLRRSYGEIQLHIQGDEAALSAQRHKLKQTQQALMQLPRPSELDDVRDEIERRKTELAENQAQAAELQTAPAQIEALQRQLAELGDPKQQHAIASARSNERSKREREQAALNLQRTGAEDELTNLTAQLAEFETLDTELAAVMAALEEHAAAYRQVLGNRQLATSVEQRRAELAQIEATYAQLAGDLQRVAAELAAAEADFDDEAYGELLGKEQQLRGEQGALQTRLSMLKTAQQRDEQIRDGLRDQQRELKRAQGQMAGLKDQEAVLEALRGVLREAGPFITATLIRQISDGAARIFGDIMQNYSRHLSWDETYEILLNVDGNERAFAQLSGGEQMSAALSVRLALLREMSSIDIAFFDEPTTNLDEARREALARQILEVKGLRQLFVISHDDTFEQATQNLIRIERVGGESQVMDAES